MLTVFPGFRSGGLFFGKQLQSLMEDTMRGFPGYFTCAALTNCKGGHFPLAKHAERHHSLSLLCFILIYSIWVQFRRGAFTFKATANMRRELIWSIRWLSADYVWVNSKEVIVGQLAAQTCSAEKCFFSAVIQKLSFGFKEWTRQ